MGPRTNLGFLSTLCRTEAFHDGRFDTDFIERNLETLGAVRNYLDAGAAAAGTARLFARQQKKIAPWLEPADSFDPWSANDAFQLNGSRIYTMPFLVDGELAEAQVSYRAGGFDLTIEGQPPVSDAIVTDAADGVFVFRRGRQAFVKPKDVEFGAEQGGEDGYVRAPMHGRIVAILVENGAEVAKGQRVAIIEAMKMEHTLAAPSAGTITEIAAAVGAQVAEGVKLMLIAPQKKE
jgi:3-methylcrotonyl-CoA carboxylase alpha subunit